MRIASTIVLALLLVLPAHASSFVSGSGAASPATLAPDRAVTAVVNWSLLEDTANDNVTSPGGVFIVDGNQLPQPVPPLSGFTDATNRVQFHETLAVPFSVVTAAARSTGVIVFQRTFLTGTFNALSLSISFRIGGGMGGVPRIQSLDLHFEDGSKAKLVAPGEDLHAVAELTLANVSHLRGVWEVSVLAAKDPQDLVFQTIGTVDEFVQYKRSLVISSPSLPTSIAGEHVARFRPLEPDLGDAVPEITFSVGGIQSGDGGGLTSPVVIGPAAGARLTPGTPISWQRMNGVDYWEIQFFRDTYTADQPGSRPVAGVRVRSTDTLVRIRATTVARLARGRTYYWRLIGASSTGRPLTKSPLRAIRA